MGVSVGGMWTAGHGVVPGLQQGHYAQETHHEIQVGESLLNRIVNRSSDQETWGMIYDFENKSRDHESRVL